MKPTVALCLEYPLALRGGVSVLVETLIPFLAERYRLVLVSPDSSHGLARCSVGGVLSGHVTWDPAAVSSETSKQLADRLAAEKVALAHFHFGGNYGWNSRLPGQCPILHVRRKGIRACSTVHSVTSILDGYCGPQKPIWFKVALLPAAWFNKMRILRCVSAEIAVSKNNAAKLRRWYWPMRGKFRQIYHSRLRTDAAKKSDQPREAFILNVGHIARRKGQRTLCAAFIGITERHRDWHLWLVGDPTEKDIVNEIQFMAKQSGLADRVDLPGERNDISGLLARAGIYVQPSYEEALGLALQEAMFAGCPVIGTTVGGIPELIDHGVNGLLVPPGNPTALAQAIDKFIDNPELRERLGQAAHESVVAKGMTVESMVARHIELYDSILKSS